MKKTFLITALAFNIYFARAQRFFYLESDDAAGTLIKDGLVKSSQFVTNTPLSSDYIIKTEIGFQKEPNKLTLQIILEDSITFKTIYQTNEEYNFGIINQNTRGSLSFSHLVAMSFTSAGRMLASFGHKVTQLVRGICISSFFGSFVLVREGAKSST